MWMEKGLAEAYFNLNDNYGNLLFTREEVAEALKKPLNNTDQIIHKLRENSALERVGWGKYKIVSPEKWIGIAKVTSVHPQLQSVFKEIFSRVSIEKIHSLVLYGSVARGESNKESDIDLMIVTNLKDRPRIERAFEKLPDKINVDIHSKEGIRNLAEETPLFVLFTEAEGEKIFDVGESYRNAASYAAYNIVRNYKKILHKYIKTEEEDIKIAKKLIDKRKKPQLAAYFLVFSTRVLLQIKQILNNKIDPYAASAGMREVLGDSYNELYNAYRFEREDKIGKERPKIKTLKDGFFKVNALLIQVKEGVKEFEKKKAAAKGD